MVNYNINLEGKTVLVTGAAGFIGNFIYGGYCGGETSLSIPNRVIKPSNADGTAKAGDLVIANFFVHAQVDESQSSILSCTTYN